MLTINQLHLKVGERQIQYHENLTFPLGSITFVKGVSGAGKTTLLYVLGLISKQKDYQYYFHGKEIVGVKEKEKIRKEHVGMMYQNFNMLEHLSLYDNLKLFADINACPMNKEEAINLLNRFSLNLDLKRKFGTLSGGEKQRFCLACILAKNPSVIIADEPTSALDKENADQLMQLLYKLSKEDGKTIIVSTHSKEYDDMADNIISLDIHEITQTKKLCEYSKNSEKTSLRKLKSSFYLSMMKQRLLRMIKNSSLVILFTVFTLALSIFLLTYVKTSEEEYTYYLSESMDNEVFLKPHNENAVLSEDDLTYIKSIPGVKNIYTIKSAYGSLKLSDGKDVTPVQVYSVMPFQRTFKNGQCAVDSSLYRYFEEDVTLVLEDYENKLEIAQIYSLEKVNQYSMQDLTKVFISEDEFNHFDYFETNQYVLEISSFNQFNNIESKIAVLTQDYYLTSAYQYFYLLLEGLEQQQTFINLTSTILICVSFVLFVMVQIHEAADKKREMCIFQSNGLNKKHILCLEILECLYKLVLFYIMSLVMSLGLILVANTFFLKTMDMTINGSYLILLFVFLLVFIIIPGIISVIYYLNQSPEDELRAID